MPGKDHINYSASDISRYHSGEMPAAERHAMEKAALDDPFLADAIEGYVFSKSPEQELATLRTALEKKTKREHAGVFFMSGSKRNTFLKIAALFILLAGTGLLIRSSLYDKTNDVALVNGKDEKKQKTPEGGTILPSNHQNQDTFPELTQSASPEKTSSATADVKIKKTAGVNKNAASISDKKKLQDEVYQLDDQVSFAEKNIQTSDAELKKDQAVKAEDKFAAVSAAPEKRSLPPSANLNTKEIRGSVTNENGQPLPYASVMVNGTRNRALTDKEGKFSLLVTDTSSLLSANAAGYEVAFVPVNNAEKNVIVLRESPALAEVVVTGQNQGRKKAPAKFIVESGDLEPEEGWIQYNEYVESKLKPIETTAKSNQRREVSLTFDVNETGEPINITVENSQCPQCNEQAIKLLKEGPKWKKGKKGKISFRF
jgi:hypothetical protein